MPNQRHSRCHHGTKLVDSWQDCPRCWDEHIRDKATWTTQDWTRRRELFPEEFPQQHREEIERQPARIKESYVPSPVPQPSPQAKGTIENIWVEFNANENAKAGLRIHVAFSIENMKDVECLLAIYFYFANGEKMRDINGAFHTTNGEISVGQVFTPPYQVAYFNDLPVFIPHEELHVSKTHNNPGGEKSVNLGFLVCLYPKLSNHLLATSALQLFNYNL